MSNGGVVMFEFFDIVNEIIHFMKQDISIDGFVFSFWDIFVYMTIFGNACWMIGRIINQD